jgi:hypothetical protein
MKKGNPGCPCCGGDGIACAAIAPNRIPETVYLAELDPAGLYDDATGGGFATVLSCSNLALTWNAGLAAWVNSAAACQLFVIVNPPFGFTFFPTVRMRCGLDAYGDPKLFLSVQCFSYVKGIGSCIHVREVEASSITASPFAATFDFADLPSSGSTECESRSSIWPALELVVAE